jgi:plastocyanin
MMRLVIACALLALASPALADEVGVEVGHNRLDPAEVRIEVGDTVVFHNVDAMPGGHTVVADDGSFESPPLEKDGRFEHTFEEKGTVTYHIEQHPDARGKIVVE